MSNWKFVQIGLILSALLVGTVAAEDDSSPGDLPPGFDVAVTIIDVNLIEGEWVEIANSGMAVQDFTFWTLIDEGNNTYKFPDGFVLVPEAKVKVHSRVGNDTATDLYWGFEESVWNEGETATLLDASGESISEYIV